VYTLQPSPVQLMMFSFWAGMMLTPSIFVDEPAGGELLAIRRGISAYVVIWSMVALLPFVVASVLAPSHVGGTRDFSILAFGVGVLGINYFVYHYFRYVRRVEHGCLQKEEVVPKVRRRWPSAVVISFIVVATVLALAIYRFWFSRPMGAGPAGPEVPRGMFRDVWTSRPVLLVGIGDSITEGFGAPAGHSYFELLISSPADESPDMAGICLEHVLPKLSYHRLAKAGTTSIQHLSDQISRLDVQPPEVFGLVVMTTGGNDLIHSYGRSPPCEGAMYGATIAQAGPWIMAFGERLSAMLRRIDECFPGGCEVFLANIYDPTDGVGDLERAGLPAWPDGSKILAIYNAIIAQHAGQRRNVHLVNLHDAFLGHGLHCTQPWSKHYCADDPHYWYYTNLEDPNDRGHDAIRRLFLREIAKVGTASTTQPAFGPVRTAG